MVWYTFKVYFTHNFFPDSNVDSLMDSKTNDGENCDIKINLCSKNHKLYKGIDLSFISLKSFNKSIV